MRELGDQAIRDQVDALKAYLERGGSAARWLTSKDYSPDDLEAIVKELRLRRLKASA